MMPSTQPNRQVDLQKMIDEALKDENLKEALAAFSMGQEEYKKAIAASMTVQVITGNTSNPTESPDI